MSNFTIDVTTNQQQNRASVAATDAENARRAAQTPPLPELTEVEYMTVKVYEVIDTWVVQLGQVESDQANVKQRWSISNEAQRTAAVSQLEPLP